MIKIAVHFFKSNFLKLLFFLFYNKKSLDFKLPGACIEITNI